MTVDLDHVLSLPKTVKYSYVRQGNKWLRSDLFFEFLLVLQTHFQREVFPRFSRFQLCCQSKLKIAKRSLVSHFCPWLFTFATSSTFVTEEYLFCIWTEGKDYFLRRNYRQRQWNSVSERGGSRTPGNRVLTELVGQEGEGLHFCVRVQSIRWRYK